MKCCDEETLSVFKVSFYGYNSDFSGEEGSIGKKQTWDVLWNEFRMNHSDDQVLSQPDILNAENSKTPERPTKQNTRHMSWETASIDSFSDDVW